MIKRAIFLHQEKDMLCIIEVLPTSGFIANAFRMAGGIKLASAVLPDNNAAFSGNLYGYPYFSNT